jgi:phosphoglycerate dehydrogenase-like enzyme
VNLLVASFLEEEHVERIRGLDPRIDVQYEKDLVPRPRYIADHFGERLARSARDEARWRTLLSGAEVLFDFDYTNAEELPTLAPSVRWIQASSAGIGQFVKRHRYAERMPRTQFTTARGVHARPLGEFCALAMLSWSRGLFRMVRDQAEGRWERFCGTDLLGKTLLIYGHGLVGRQVAAFAQAFGMRRIGIRRSPGAESPESLSVDEVHGPEDLPALLPDADVLVLAAPHTGDTEGVIGPRELALLKPGALLVNIGRGALVDEAALVEALRTGRLGGAVLDVFQEEPLPQASPLWTLPNVLVSPHSASTSERENALLTDLFCRNLRRYLEGEPLENVFDASRLY